MLNNTLINEKYLKLFAVLPLNFDTTETENFVKLSEVIWVKPLIGDDFYDELLDQVENNTLTPENGTALVEAIYPYLAMAVCLEALPSLAYRVTAVGVVKNSSDNSQSIELKELSYYESFLRRQVEARKDYCKKWLCEHRESFPLLNCCSCGCSCCNDNAKLTNPNKYQQLYKPYRKNIDLK